MAEMKERARTMTDSDVQAIIIALKEHKCNCRYDIDPEEMKEMFIFVKNWNETIADGKKTIRTTILVSIITGLFLLLGLGAVARIQESIPK